MLAMNLLVGWQFDLAALAVLVVTSPLWGRWFIRYADKALDDYGD